MSRSPSCRILALFVSPLDWFHLAKRSRSSSNKRISLNSSLLAPVHGCAPEDSPFIRAHPVHSDLPDEYSFRGPPFEKLNLKKVVVEPIFRHAVWRSPKGGRGTPHFGVRKTRTLLFLYFRGRSFGRIRMLVFPIGLGRRRISAHRVREGGVHEITTFRQVHTGSG